MSAFQDLLGKQVFFYGVDEHRVKLDNTIWEAVESDRGLSQSALNYITITDRGQFSKDPLAIVTVSGISLSNSFSGYLIKDLDGHIWVRIGTNISGTWKFVFHYTPPESHKPKPKFLITEYDPLDQLFESRDV